MAQRKKTHFLTAASGKPPGMNLAAFLQFKQMLYDDALKAAKNELNRVLGDRQAQRLSWLYIIALGKLHHFTPQQAAELEASVKTLAAEYRKHSEEHGQDSADEDLRRQVSEVRGHEVQYLYADQYPVNQDLTGEEISALREAEGRIY